MTLPARKPLIGRGDEIAQLRNALAASEQTGVTLAELVGPQGIGKSALLMWLKEAAHREHFTVLDATAFRQEAELPYGVLASLLDSTISTPRWRSRLDSFDTAALAAALPNLRRAAQVTQPEPLERIELLRAINAAMSVLAEGSRGLVLIVDNSDWADDATFTALGYVCRRGVGAPLLIATAARSRRTDLSLRTAVQHVEDVVLGPMPDDQLAAIMVDAPVALRGQILTEAHGNPFFAVELASHRSLTAHTQDGHNRPLPLSVSDIVRADLAAVPTRAQQLAHAAAVLGDGSAAVNAIELAGLTEDEGFAALDDLVEGAMVVPLEHGAVRFRHPLVTHAIYESMTPGTRLELHVHAAALLSGSGNDPVGAARHLVACASEGDEEAIDTITFAALATRGLAPRASIEFTEAALRLIPAHGPLAKKRPLLQTIMTDSLIRTGRFDEAQRTVKQAMAVRPPEDTIALAWQTMALIRILRWTGHNDSALDITSEALAMIGEDNPFERAALEAVMAIEMSQGADLESAREYGRSATRNAERSEEPAMRLCALVACGFVEVMSGDPHAAVDFVVRARDLMEHLPAEQFTLALDGIAILCSLEDWVGRHQEALMTAARGRAASLESGNQHAEFWFGLTAAVALTALGRLGSAEETVESAEELARTLEHPALTAVSLALTAKIWAKEGDMVKTQRAVDECFAYLELVKDESLYLTAVGLALPAVVTLGRHSEALDLMVRAGQSEGLPGIPVPQRASLYEQLVIAELGRSELAAAQRWSQLADQNAEKADLDSTRIPAARASALVSRALGEPETSAASAMVAVDAARRERQPLEVAQSLLVAGKSYSIAGRSDDAIAAFDEAGTLFAKAGARGSAAHARQHLRELGVRSRGPRVRPGSDGVDALSGREREVAELVTTGLSNPQIAEQLYLSVRTVESHLRRIFTKLGAGSRADVGALVRRNQIVN